MALEDAAANLPQIIITDSEAALAAAGRLFPALERLYVNGDASIVPVGRRLVFMPSAGRVTEARALADKLVNLAAEVKLCAPEPERPAGWSIADLPDGAGGTWAKATRETIPIPARSQAEAATPGADAPSPPLEHSLSAQSGSGLEPPDLDIPPIGLPEPPPGRRKRRGRADLSLVDGNAARAPDPEDEPLPVAMSEDALATHFAAQHGEDWRYVKKWDQWFRYDGEGWRRDETEQAFRLSIELCRASIQWPEAASLTMDQKRRLARRATAGSVRDMARNDRAIAAGVDQWDADPFLVGVPGGVFDVQTGKIISGEREHYITKRCAVAPRAGRPSQWLAHLERMQSGDQAMIDWLQLFSGYCATGDVSEQIFAFFYGLGQTGKGTFLLTIGELLGDYGAFSEASTFLKRQGDRHLSEIARFNGCRMVIIDELPSNSTWNEERIKRVTGGGKLTVNFMHQDPFDMPIRFKLAVASNSKPNLRRVGKEMERRIRLVKCNASIPDEEVDRNFRERMIANEGPQILNWILDGAMRWKEAGLTHPDSIQSATRDYLQSVDILGDWLLECTEQSGQTERPKAYENFKAWFAKQGNDHAWGPQAWWSAMEDRGYVMKRTASARYVLGLTLKLGAAL